MRKGSFFLAVVCLFSALLLPTSYADDLDVKAQAEMITDGILSYLQPQGDGQAALNDLAAQAGKGGEWYALSLSQLGEYDFSAYEAALLQHAKATRTPTVTRQKYALCLAGMGSTDSYLLSVMEDSIGEGGIMSEIFGLHLLNNGYTSTVHNIEAVTARLLSAQCADGGWTLTGQTGMSDVTAMALQALAPQASKSEVAVAIDAALGFLSAAQLPQGDYIAYGVPNPESTSQVLIALCSLGIDPENDARFLKNGVTLMDAILRYRLPNGGFCHTVGGGVNTNATSQVLCAAVAYLRFANGKTPLYLLDRADPRAVEPPTTNSEAQVPDPLPDSAKPNGKQVSYKLWASLAVIVLALLCIAWLLWRKSNRKNLLAVLLAAVLLIGVILMTDLYTPKDYYNGQALKKENVVGQVHLSIRCDAVAGMNSSAELPSDGWILPPTEFELSEGETVYRILIEAARRYGIPLESNGSEAMPYISGIAGLYEFDHGDLSGWRYLVNGQEVSVGCGEYRLSDGDVVEWYYTLTAGSEMGG